MAYREFAKPVEQPAIDYSPIAQGLSSFFQSIGKGIEKRKTLADQYKYALDYGKFENDNKFITNYVQKVTRLGKDTMRERGGYTPELIDAEQYGKQMKADMDAQYERWKNLNSQIDKREDDDLYYDGSIDRRKLNLAAFGEDGKRDFTTRGQELDKASVTIGNDPATFKYVKFRSDYINDIGVKHQVKSSGNPDAKSTTENKSPFWDPATGKPGVTDDHAIEYIKSDARVGQYFDWQLDQQLSDEIKSMRASKDSRNNWMKGMTDAEIKAELINDPSKNLINKQEYGQRKRELAKKSLEEGADIYRKTDYERKLDTTATGGLYRNDAIAHDYTFSTIQTASTVMGPFQPGENPPTAQISGPGGVLMINKGMTTGKPINFDIQSKTGYNIRSGRKTRIVGKQPFNLTGYQLQVYRKNGTPYLLQANNEQELQAAINNIPSKDWNDLMPEPRIALVGYTLDKTRLLGDINDMTYNISQQLGKAKSENNTEQIATLENQLYELEELQVDINNPEFSNTDILNMAASRNITGLRVDQMILADKADIDKVNNVTQGLNLSNKAKWSDEMKAFDEAYRQRYQQSSSAVPQKINKTNIIQSDGSDVETWSKDNEYKVGSSTYFFDKKSGQWAKR